MGDFQLASGIWVSDKSLGIEGKGDRIQAAEYPRGPVDSYQVVSRFKDFSSYLRAIKIAWVWAAVSVIGYNFAATKYGLLDAKNPEDDPDDNPDNPLIQLMQKPNPNQTGFRFMEQYTFYQELTGNAYITMEEVDASGQPRELYLPNPARMRIVPGPDGIAGYIYDASPHGNTGAMGNGLLIPYDKDEVIHVAGPAVFDGYYGVGNVEASETLLNIVTAMTQQEFSYWDSGGRIIGVLETDHRLSDQDFMRLKRDWQLASSDKRQRVRTAILEQGLKYTPIAEGMRSLDLVNIDKSKRDQILAVFGVPLPKVGIMEMAQYKMDEADAFFWQETMHPKFDRWEDAFQPLVDRFDPTQAWAFERKTFEDDSYKLDNATKGFLAGLMTLDEARAVMGLPPLPNGNGEVIILSSSYTPIHIEDVGTIADQSAAPPAPALPPGGTQPPASSGADETMTTPEDHSDNLVHLTDHLPADVAKDLALSREHWKRTTAHRKAAATRSAAKSFARPGSPMERAARVYAPRRPADGD